MTALEFEQLKTQFTLFHRHCQGWCFQRWCFVLWWVEEGKND